MFELPNTEILGELLVQMQERAPELAELPLSLFNGSVPADLNELPGWWSGLYSCISLEECLDVQH